MNKRTIAKVLGILLAAVLVLELVYVIAAKVVLKKLPEWASYEALQISYSDAGSWIPGRAWARDVAIRGHDYNMQFEVRVKEAQVHIDMFALFSQHFHATKAITSGVEFRMRHNVESLDGQKGRIAAFPSIEGYEAPPVYPGPDPEPGPPEGAWLIQMEDVDAQVNDVWVLELHYAGRGTAKGGFTLDPGRAFQLEPSRFVWEGGELLVGETSVSRETVGTVEMEMHLDDISQIEGFNFFDKMKVDLALSLADGDLAFLDLYSSMTSVRRATGHYSVDMRLIADKGKVLEGTELEAKFRQILLTAPDLIVATSGQLDVAAEHDADGTMVNLTPLNVTLRDTVVAIDGTRSKSFSATINSNSARVITDKPSTALQATVDVRVKPGDALLQVAVGATPAAIAKAFLDLPELHTRVAMYLTEKRSRIELLHLDAGDIEASGAWQDKPAGATGGFTVKTPLADIGLVLDRTGVSWDLE